MMSHLSHLHVICLQLVQEFKLLLLVGRRLVFPAQSSAAVRADIRSSSRQQMAPLPCAQASSCSQPTAGLLSD
jgi:hypothetical protein